MVDQDETMRLSQGAAQEGTNKERWLVVLAGSKTQNIRLPEAGVLVVGRSPQCDIIIVDPSVSREHLRLVVAESLFVEDLGAVNATRVGGVAIRAGERVPVSPGVLIDVGSVGIMVRLGPSTEATQSAPSPTVGIERVAKSTLTVLIQGETGSGKEVMAETIHRLSPRADQPLLRLNCAAFSDTLMESELFGHERGAFTGAVTAKAGLLETAEGGTVFLDEIGDLGLLLQAKLLRVLEERKVWRVGSLKPKSIDVRFVAATNRDLEQAASEGKFRQDLLFRLNAVTVRVAPLRERTGEIEALAMEFVAEGCRAMNRPTLALDGGALQALLRYSWPGNIRELRNVMGRAVATSEGPVIHEQDLSLRRETHAERASVPPSVPVSSRGEGNLHADVEALEEDRIQKALKASNYNRTKAAQALGIARNTLASRMARFNIRVPDRDD